jgi:hypothetical protein
VVLLCRVGDGFVSFEADDVGVVHDPVDHRGGDGGVAEYLAPAN